MILSFQEIFLIDQERKNLEKYFFNFIYPDLSSETSSLLNKKSKFKRD